MSLQMHNIKKIDFYVKYYIIKGHGAMSERLMVQSWKGCVLNGTPGSNPGRSAMKAKNPVKGFLFF